MDRTPVGYGQNSYTSIMANIPVLFVCFFLVVIGYAIWAVSEARKRRESAKFDYDAALAAYRRAPADLALREQAMQAGRAYSLSTRAFRGGGSDGSRPYESRDFDEVALRNDLDLVAEGARFLPPIGPVAADSKPTVTARLQQVADLYTEGVISEDEYTQRRQEILREI
ncbi:MAG: SHOCT domain-containing protein [Fimbriimonas sp.]|nr:SHOCT domain-containing protein [Fimbriimonas sp.]